MSEAAPPAGVKKVSLAQIFLAFLTIGATSFGARPIFGSLNVKAFSSACRAAQTSTWP